MPKKHKRRKSRRVGAFRMGGKDTGVKLLAVGAGFLLGNTVNAVIDKVLPKDESSTLTPKPVSKNGETIGMAAQIGIGGMLLLRKQGGTTGMAIKVAGGLLAGAGIKRALKVLGVMGGYQSVPVIGRHRMAGYQSVPVIGASTTPAQLAGRTPPQLSGYRPAGSGVGSYVNQGSGVMGGIGCCDPGSGSGITNPGSGYLS